MSVAKFKDLAEAIYASLSTVAIIVAGLWVYWNFVLQRERESRAEFDLTAEFLGRQDGMWLLEVSARLANKGKVRHLMKDATLNIRYLTADDPIRESKNEDHFKQIEFTHEIERRKVWWDSYIDPGLEFRNSYVTAVPENATYIILLCQFKYDKGNIWPAQRALKVPHSDTPAPGKNEAAALTPTGDGAGEPTTVAD